MIVKNVKELTSHGNVEGRRVVLNIIDFALMRVNSYYLTRKLIKCRGNVLKIKSLRYDLSRIKHVYVVGAGKNSTFIASALEDVLKNRLNEGVIIEKKGWGCKTRKIAVVEGGHPIPDEASLRGTREIIGIVRKAREDDLVFTCITGGCTSLTLHPPKGVSLEDVQKISDLLLRSGAPIEDVNTVRKHLSIIGGGKLTLLAHPAEIVSLIVIDEIARKPWGPTVPDTTSFHDAINVLKKYNLWSKTPESIKKYFKESREETPKIKDFKRLGVKVRNIVLADNRVLCKAAEEKGRMLGLNTFTLSTSIEGEAKDVGIVLASIAKEIWSSNRLARKPCVIIAGGETTVTIRGRAGEGGRNQELTLAASMKIRGGIVIASIGTNGTDGPTNIAGAIADSYTLARAKRIRIDVFKHLKRHNSSYVFKKLRDAIYTNPTGTNLMDLIVIYIGRGGGCL